MVAGLLMLGFFGDAVYGALQKSMGAAPPIAMASRFLLFAYLFAILAGIPSMRRIFLPLLFFPAVIAANVFLNPRYDTTYFTFDVLEALKNVSLILGYLVFRALLARGLLSRTAAMNGLAILAILYSVPILLGPLGVGFQSYIGASGFKGFVYAQNELSALLLGLFPFTLVFAFERSSRWAKILPLIVFVAGVMTTQKAAIGGLTAEYLVMAWIGSRLAPMGGRRPWRYVVAVAAILGAIGWGLSNDALISALFGRIMYFWSISDTLQAFLLSGREYDATILMANFLSASWPNLLFGFTPSVTLYQMGNSELDLLNIALQWGVPFLTLLTFLYATWVVRLINKARSSGEYLTYAQGVALAAFLAQAVLAGHALSSAIASVPLALILALPPPERQEAPPCAAS
jgi:uncharacterized membrane protein YuzA (DUF378 family)